MCEWCNAPREGRSRQIKAGAGNTSAEWRRRVLSGEGAQQRHRSMQTRVTQCQAGGLFMVLKSMLEWGVVEECGLGADGLGHLLGLSIGGRLNIGQSFLALVLAASDSQQAGGAGDHARQLEQRLPSLGLWVGADCAGRALQPLPSPPHCLAFSCGASSSLNLALLQVPWLNTRYSNLCE